MPHKNNLSREQLKILSLLLLLLTLSYIIIAGLWPFNIYPLNNIHWQNNSWGKHLSITQPSVAYLTPELTKIDSHEGFSIEIKLKSNSVANSHIARIFSLTSNNTELLLIGQWKSGILVRLLDPSINKKYEMYVKEVLKSSEPVLVTFTVSKSSYLIHCNGRLVLNKENSRFTQNTPLEGVAIIGNSITGEHGWNGELHSLKIYDHPLLQQESVREKDQNCFSSPLPNHNLVIPKHFSPLKRRILTPPWVDFKPNKSYLSDIILNFAGFIPLGFIIGVLSVQARKNKRQPIILSFIFCVLISLTIELLQILLPSRSSQLSDLILNTLGGVSGTLLLLSVCKSHTFSFLKSICQWP